MPPKSKGSEVDRAKILKAFSSEVDCALQKERNQPCASGTGLWFFHHPVYEAFRSAKGAQLLFVTAEAGGGKSTIIRTLVDKLTENNIGLVAYFFFKDDHNRLSSYEEALSCLIHQLLDRDPTLSKHVGEIYRKHGDAVRHDTSAMWDVLSEIAVNSQQDIFCAVDAIDECRADDRGQLIDDLRAFVGNTRRADSRLKFIVSSRPYSGLHCKPSGNIRHLVGEDASVRSDINQVILSKAEDLAKEQNLNDATREMLVQNISAQNRHTRSFLAVQMAFELLRSHHNMHIGAEEGAIADILSKIPDKLDKQFDEMLSRSLDGEHARRIFCVVLAARRTIKIGELKVIYALTKPIGPGSHLATSYDDLELISDDDEFKRLVRATCGLFITVVKHYVHLFHQTAREYLLDRTQTSPENERAAVPLFTVDKTSWKGSITLERAHFVCATLCLDILNLTIPENVILEAFDGLEAGNNFETEMAGFSSTRPFYVYAAYNWHEHITAAGPGRSRLLADIQYCALFDISSPKFWGWFLSVADYVNSSTMRKKLPISSVWDRTRQHRDCGRFLREDCLQKLYGMDKHVHALLGADTATIPQASTPEESIKWKVENGFYLVDRFHLAYGDHEFTSFSRAIHAIETGETSVLANIPPNTFIWTSITTGSPKALKQALIASADLSWLHKIPGHIIHRREKWSGWSSRTGKDLRESLESEWTHPYPSSFVVILRASTLDSSTLLFDTLAAWIGGHPQKTDYAQKLWDAGGFIIPSFSRRLAALGALIDRPLWEGGRTALQVAATYWAHDAVLTLLELGADSTKRTANGFNVLHWFSCNEHMYMGSTTTSESAIRPRLFPGHFRKSSIASSTKAMAGSVSGQHLLSQSCSQGLSPLMHAITSSRSSPTAVKALLEAGAEVDQRDDQGRTALMHFFCQKMFIGRSPSILELLLLAGANSTASDDAGKSVLSYFASLVTSTKLSYLYAGFNKYNKAFHALTTIGPLSQRETLHQELNGLKIPLVVAARLGNAEMCSALLSTGAHPDHHGIEPGSDLEKNSGSEANDLEDLGWNPLMVALWSKAFVTAALLIEHGAAIDYETPKKKRTKYNKYRVKRASTTPLHVSIMTDPYGFGREETNPTAGSSSRGCAFRAVAQSDYPVPGMSDLERLGRFQQLRYRNPKDQGDESSDSEVEKERSSTTNESRGANLVPYDTIRNMESSPDKSDGSIVTTLVSTCSAQAQRQEVLIEFMLSTRASANACTLENITPLALCVKQGILNITKALLKHGADPNIADAGGCTPLMLAAKRGHHDIAESLLAAGADPNAQVIPQLPDKCNCCTIVQGSGSTYYACHAPMTALALAAEGKHQSVVDLLLDHKADPNQKIEHHVHGRLPSARDKRRMDRILYHASDDEESDDEVDQWKGFISVATALTWARDEVRETLLRRGADPSVEEPTRECGCVIVERERPGLFESESEYPSREGSTTSEKAVETVESSAQTVIHTGITKA